MNKEARKRERKKKKKKISKTLRNCQRGKGRYTASNRKIARIDGLSNVKSCQEVVDALKQCMRYGTRNIENTYEISPKFTL